MKIIPVEYCCGDLELLETEDFCHYGYWSIDTINRRCFAVCDYEDKHIKIFNPTDKISARIEIPDWCPLEVKP